MPGSRPGGNRSERPSADLLTAWLRNNARAAPDKAAIESIAQGKSISHGELYDLCAQIGGYLDDKGFRAGDRVALLSNNSIEHLAVYLGVMAYGATVCTVHVEMNLENLADILHALGPRLSLFEEGLAPDPIREAAPGSGSPSGSGNPKGARDSSPRPHDFPPTPAAPAPDPAISPRSSIPRARNHGPREWYLRSPI